MDGYKRRPTRHLPLSLAVDFRTPPPTIYIGTYRGLYYSKVILPSVSVAERHPTSGKGFTLVGREIRALSPMTVYNAAGKVVLRLNTGEGAKLNRGIYFVSSLKGIGRVLVE